MNTQTTTLPRVELIPTREGPLYVKDATAETCLGWEDIVESYGVGDEFRCLFLQEVPSKISQLIHIDLNRLSIAEIERLAAGEELRAPIGKIEKAGRIRLLRGHENGTLTMVVLEFLPDELISKEMTFSSWLYLRFPEPSRTLDEAWLIHFHTLWTQETLLAPTLAPDDGMLWRAVLNNHEHLVEAILKHQPRIEVRPGTEKSIEETALGVAMENTGMFGADSGFPCGCLRHYGNDDFTMAEDSETWVPRAERIAERLKAAGAIDYSPILAACRAGRTEEVEAMLKEGFPPNFSVYGHTTALCEAVQAGHEDICDLLICYGADVNQHLPILTSMIDGGEIYPLSLATEHPSILRRLLQAGADPSIRRDNSEQTPVVLAVNYESRENAEEVFSQVDFASIRGQHDRSGVFYLNAENLEWCRNVIPAELLDAYDELGMTPLLHALIAEDDEKALLLMQMGADPSLPGIAWDGVVNKYARSSNTGQIPSQRVTPIQTALIYGKLQLVEDMFDQGIVATRYSQAIRVSEQMDDETFETLRTRLDADLDVLAPALVIKSTEVDYFYYPKSFALSPRLGTLIMNDPDAASRYPEYVEDFDLVGLAESAGLNPALIEPFRSGRKLTKAGWAKFAADEINALKEAVESFASALEDSHSEGEHSESEQSSSWVMSHALNEAEAALKQARERITGKPAPSRDLTSDVADIASSEFDGGTARGLRSSKSTGEATVEDFIECLAEALRPGTTMDKGKLLQSTRAAIPRLENECADLLRQV